jgi:hypothetical protein
VEIDFRLLNNLKVKQGPSLDAKKVGLFSQTKTETEFDFSKKPTHGRSWYRKRGWEPSWISVFNWKSVSETETDQKIVFFISNLWPRFTLLLLEYYHYVSIKKLIKSYIADLWINYWLINPYRFDERKKVHNNKRQIIFQSVFNFYQNFTPVHHVNQRKSHLMK